VNKKNRQRDTPLPTNDKFKDYARYAEHCLSLTADTTDQEARSLRRDMAAEWLTLANAIHPSHKSWKILRLKPVTIAWLLISASSAFAEGGEKTIKCMTSETLMTCISKQPCDVYVRSPNGQVTARAKIVIPDAISAGDFNQGEFERAVESRCGKLND
jgi:hypothetical protein